jgi:hypothetical protein
MLLSEHAKIKTYRALYRTTFRSGNDSWSARQAILFNMPNQLRIEALPLVGLNTLSLLVTNEGRALFLDPTKREAYSGNAESGFFNRFLKVNASERELMSLFIGRVPERYLNYNELEIFEDDSAITIVKGRGTHLWILDKKSLILKRAEIREQFQGKLLFALEYGPGMKISNGEKEEVYVPKGIAIRSLIDTESIADSSLIMAKANLPVDFELFKMSIPSNFKVENF